MVKHKIYKNILARQNVMDYITGINFETSLVNMDKAKSHIKRDLVHTKMPPTLSLSGMYQKSFLYLRNKTNSQ